MRLSPSLSRPLALALLAVSVAGLSGCKWFGKKGPKGDYALSPETRPLEVPPDLNLPSTSAAMQLPNTASQVRAQSQAATASPTSFNVIGSSRDDAFNKVGEALAGIEGVTIVTRAQMLGSYDLSYEGSNFLVRVAAAGADANVSAVDPRGLPASGDAPAKLIAALKAKLGVQ